MAEKFNLQYFSTGNILRQRIQQADELGKQLAQNILPELKDDRPVRTHDASTNGLINAFKEMRKEMKR